MMHDRRLPRRSLLRAGLGAGLSATFPGAGLGCRRVAQAGNQAPLGRLLTIGEPSLVNATDRTVVVVPLSANDLSPRLWQRLALTGDLDFLALT